MLPDPERHGILSGINSSAVDCRVTSSLHVGPAARRAHASVTAVDCRGSQSLLSSPDPLVPLGAREKPAASKLGDVSALAARIDYGRKKSGLDTASHAGATRSPDDRQTLKWTINNTLYIRGPCTVYVRTCPRIPIDAVVVSWPQNVFCDLVYATIIRRHASRRITITSHGFGSVGAISSVQSSKQPSPCIMLQ